MSNIIEAHDLVMQFPGSDQPAVRGVSFAVLRGEIFGLLGPAGAGKTTLIALLSGRLKPTSGSATIAGFDLSNQLKEIKRRAGLAPQDSALYPALSANDNLVFYGRTLGLRGKQLKQRVEAALQLAGLYDCRHDPIEAYSGGMRRCVNIAAGLLRQPEILFLDEPTAGVDPQSRDFILAKTVEVNRQGVTVLHATRCAAEAERLCRRVAIIDQGRIVALDTPHALQEIVGGGLVVIVSLEVLEPNLESVFFELTGRRLGD